MARVGAKPPTGKKTEAAEPASAAARIQQADTLAKTTPAQPKAAQPKPVAPGTATQPASTKLPGPAKKPAPESAKPPATDAAPEEKPVKFNAWELEDKVDPKGESDDDFGDFLKSLGEK
jgi:hypothetical protein